MKKITSYYLVSWIVLIYVLVWIIPIFYAFTFTFEINQFLTQTIKIIISISLFTVALVTGLVIILSRRKRYKKLVYSFYRNEYATIMILTGFGILGITVMFLEYGGNRDYLLHLLILLFLTNYFIVLELGSRVFNVKLFQNR